MLRTVAVARDPCPVRARAALGARCSGVRASARLRAAGLPACPPALGSWAGPSTITFGLDGKPHYINGPYEDPQRVLATLERAVGRGGFHYTVSLAEADDLGDGYCYSAVLTDRDDHLSDAV